MIGFLLIVAFATLGYRLVDLQILRHDELRTRAEGNTRKTLVREPLRGEIRDRRGNLLAGSLFVKTICADPSLIGPHRALVARTLAPLLQINENELSQKLQLRHWVNQSGKTNIDKHVILKKKVSLETWERVQLAMKSIDFGVDFRALPWKQRMPFWNVRERAIFTEPYDDQIRIYPGGSLASHLLGFVGLDSRSTLLGEVAETSGKGGLELELNPVLTGIQGWRKTEVVRSRELVAYRGQDVEPRSGLHAVLTLDAGLQHIVESELAEVMRLHSPASASAIVVRPQTGEILAMATLPNFDPNRPGKAPVDHWRNRVISDSFEPGSTFKIVAVAGALNDGIVTPQTQFDCENGRFLFAGRWLKDDHACGVLTVEEIIIKSSNIGTAKIAIRMGAPRLYEYIRNFGFGSVTGLPVGGEVRGIVHPPKQWSKLSISRIPMGQGIAVTPLQMVMAMSAMANRGQLMRPMLVDRLVDDDGNVVVQHRPQVVRQVVSETTAQHMVRALQGVVSTNGTARPAQLDHYTVAGKTGTAQKPGRGAYMPGKYFSSFIGFFPVENPELCISVVLDEPKLPNYYGGKTAAPAFKNIAERAAKYLAIKPDLIPPASREGISRPMPAAGLASHRRTN